jgi:hypothetical protein
MYVGDCLGSGEAGREKGRDTEEGRGPKCATCIWLKTAKRGTPNTGKKG